MELYVVVALIGVALLVAELLLSTGGLLAALGVAGVHVNRDPDLLHVRQTMGLSGSLLRAGERWQQHARENSDNGNDDQQLNQREAVAGRSGL